MDGLKLEKCPFCGGEAIIWEGPGYYKIRCRSHYECAASVGPYDTEKEAIAAWNRRPPAKQLTLEELRGMEESTPLWLVRQGVGEHTLFAGMDEHAVYFVKFPGGAVRVRQDDYGTTWTAFDRKPENTPSKESSRQDA